MRNTVSFIPATTGLTGFITSEYRKVFVNKVPVLGFAFRGDWELVGKALAETDALFHALHPSCSNSDYIGDSYAGRLIWFDSLPTAKIKAAIRTIAEYYGISVKEV